MGQRATLKVLYIGYNDLLPKFLETPISDINRNMIIDKREYMKAEVIIFRAYIDDKVEYKILKSRF